MNQAHHITKVIGKALEENKNFFGVYLDIAQTFDEVWHKSLLMAL